MQHFKLATSGALLIIGISWTIGNPKLFSRQLSLARSKRLKIIPFITNWTLNISGKLQIQKNARDEPSGSMQQSWMQRKAALRRVIHPQ